MPPTIPELRRRIATLRRGKANVRFRQLAALAKSLGRVEVKRGKHPTFELPDRRRPPLPIPSHSRTMSPSTVADILDFLEEDLDFLEAPRGTETEGEE